MLKEALKLISRAQKILILLHEFPDGDTVASSLALYLALKKLGKEVVCACKDNVPEPFLFLSATDQVQCDFLLGDFELIVIIDCGDLRRTGFPERLRKLIKTKKVQILNIDHHSKSDVFKLATVNFVDTSVAAAGELVFQLIEALKIKITPQIATCLLTAIYTDTGGFQFSNTTPTVLQLAGTFLTLGARLKDVTQNIVLTKSVSMLKLWGIALSRVRLSGLGIASTVVLQKDLKEHGASAEDVAGIVNLVNSIPNARLSILFFEAETGKIKASLRCGSTGDVDVSRLAAVFGGGGHKKAAGFYLDGKIVAENGGWKIKLDG